MTQSELFDPVRADGRKARGQKQVLDNSKEEWKEQIFQIIRYLAATRKEFTFDDVRMSAKKACFMPPHHPGAWGAVMRSAATSLKCIRKTGRYRKSSLVSSHSRPQEIWESTL